MGQKKVDRTKVWQANQIDEEWKRRTEQALADIEAKKQTELTGEKEE